MEGGRLTAESLSSVVPQFNWVFLVELIVCGVLTLFFLFYFNRLFATIVSYPIRAYTWHYYGVYVDIHALQISLLGGRIFFKGFRYHGENETILVQSGYLTWKYWLRSVRKVDLSRSSEDGAESSRHPVGESDSEESTRSPSPSTAQRGGCTAANRLPCRLELTLHGLEWFVYNRSAAYDSILSGFGYTLRREPSGSDNDQNDHTGKNNDDELESPNSAQTGKGSIDSKDSAKSPSGVGSTPSERSKIANNTRIRSSRKELPSQESRKSCSSSSTEEVSRSKLLALLPLGLVCNKGAMVMGNENTKTFLTAKFERASGHIDARNSGPLDMFRQIFEFRLRHPVVQMKPNPDFKQSQQAAASGLRASDGDQESERHEQGLHSRYQRHRRRIWHNLRDLIPYFQSSVESFHVGAGKDTRGASSGSPTKTGLPGESRWLGLTRYLDEDDRDAHEGWSAIEYGRFSTLIDCPSLRFTYYWDIPGKVPRGGMHSRLSVHKLSNDINGADPPEWGMHLCIKGGTINYGPWADRERVGIQTIFFPNFYRDSQPSPPLEADAPRQSTKFKLTINIEQDTTLRIPTREASKDWLWKGRVDAVGGVSKLKGQKEKKHPRNKDAEKSTHGPDIRPFGWFAIRIAANSTIRYSMDMVVSNTGYKNQLELDLCGSRVTSSVNHGLLWSSGAQTISLDLSNPLKWNILHTWSINVYSQNLELFLLRDHIFLLTDLVNDWISGPPPDFYTFVPFRYKINFSFTNFKLFMNVNDSNIINNPSDTNDNTFLVIHSEHLTSNLTIPVEKYRPKSNAIIFDVNLSSGSIELVTPLWNTQRVFLQDNSVATLKAMSLTGSYKYNIETSTELTDRLTLDIVGVSPKLCLYGFLIRYFLMIKENYFGEHLHFKTLEEYQGLLATTDTPEESSGVDPSPKTNDLDIFVQIHADSGSIFLPANIYDRTNCVRIDTVSFDTDLRFTNYYMDMETSFGPAEFVIDSAQPDGSHISSNTQLFLDGLSIYGHRLFGLPPTEPTYVCNWDFRVGHIAGECTPTFLKSAASAIRFLAFSFDDEENALPPLHPVVIHDVTFLRAKVNCIRIWVLVEEFAILFSSGVVELDFNDWADLQFSERLNLNLPDLILAVVDRNAAIRLRQPSRETVKTHGYFETSLLLKMVERKSNFFAARGLQQEHIRVHDQRSNRTPWLLHSDENTFPHLAMDTSNAKVSPPAIRLPLMPEPIQSIHTFYPDSSSSSSFPYTTSGKSSIRSSQSSESRRANFPHFNHVRPTTNIPKSRIPGPAPYDSGIRDARITSKSQSAHSPEQGVRERDKTPSFINGISSPWAMPYFHFNGIEPDVADVPTLPHADALPEQREWDLGSDIAIDSRPNYENSTQVFFHCNFKRGLRGLGSPEALSAVSSLFDELQPSHPVDIIDNLQARVISDILAHEKAMASPKKKSNFSLVFPHSHIRFINSSMSMDEDQLGNFRDQYDLKLTRIRATCRTAVESKRDDHVQPTKTSFAIHVAADSVSLSAHGEKIEALDRKGLVHCTLKNIICWSASEQTQRSHIQIQDIETVTSSKSVQDSAFLIDRTTKLVNSIVAPFQESSAAYTRRLRCLVYTLTNHGSQTPDPLFLTRTSYVLRAAQDHLRLHDSWKIISRLRNIYNYLPAGQISKLTCDCKANTIPYPSDARTTVLSNFDRWRTWDLAHVKKSAVMKVIWGNWEDGNNNLHRSANQSFTLNMNKIRFCLDPGPKESELLLQGFSSSMSVAISPMKQPSAGDYRSIAVQTYCSNISLGLKWEICELVEGIVKMVSGKQKETGAPRDVSHEAKPTAKGDDIHFVFLTDDGSVVIDGININVALRGSGIKGSVIHQPSGQDSRSSTSVVVSSDESSAQFSSRLKDLMIWRLMSPNVFVSHTSQVSGTRIKHDWKSAAACQRLRYDMNEDPLGIVQVVDRIVEDEVKYIMGLVSVVEPSQTQPEARPNIPRKKIIHRFHVAMFLDDYDIQFLLLPSLVYAISGEVARLSIAPAKGSKLELDFDVKNNSHKFWTDNERDSSIISALDIPPINGRIMVATPPNRTSVDIDTIIELTKVDAGAVRNLLGALNGPEISHLLADLEHDTRILIQHFDRLVSRGRTSPKTKPSDRAAHDLVYKVRLTLAGVDIFATAPGLSSKDYSADMNLTVGLVQFHLENASLSGPILHHPEFNLLLSRITFDLKKRDKVNTQPYGSLLLDAQIFGTSKINDYGDVVRSYDVVNNGLQIELYAETASMIVDIAAHLQERLKTLDLSQEVKHLRKLRLITATEKRPSMEARGQQPDSQSLFNAMYSVVLANIQVSWMISTPASCHQGRQPEDLVFSIRKVELATRRKSAARLRIEDMQLQMVPLQMDKRKRSRNSALLPEAVFNVAYLSNGNERRLAFQAAGKELDIRMTSEFILPASILQDSIALASENLRKAIRLWSAAIPPEKKKASSSPRIVRLASLLIDADFSGAVVSLQGRQDDMATSTVSPTARSNRTAGGGKYGQYIQQDTETTATLRAPGVALKVQFEDSGDGEPTLNAEMKVDASTNVLHPTFVPLITQISESVKEIVGESDGSKDLSSKSQPVQDHSFEKPPDKNDPTTILGRCKLNVGLRICRQEFTLSCQPIARVLATACFDDSYITVNTVQSAEQRRFFAMSLAFNALQASVKHVYSSESTASLTVDSIVMSMMNSKHVSSNSGISAILKISPTKLQVNAKQVQDFLLFREIWIPPEGPPKGQPVNPQPPATDTQAYLVQRYQQMTATGSFPWNAVIAITQLDISLDLGQTLGKSEFTIKDLWLSSKKTSDWEQNLCVGFEDIAVESKGRLSGAIGLQEFKVRTSIQWPDYDQKSYQTPLIQASAGFNRLQAKVSFEYQPFLVADVTSFAFCMYNVRNTSASQKDYLVSVLEGDNFQVLCTSFTASQGLALYQTLQRFLQEKQTAYQSSLKEIERFLRRKSTIGFGDLQQTVGTPLAKNVDEDSQKMPISLHTEVVVLLKSIHIGAFPGTFHDHQIFKLVALDAEARFSVAAENGRIHSGLGLTLGQLKVALSSVSRPATAQEPATEDLSVHDIVMRAEESRGGTILNVPRVIASMETWQALHSNQIDYIFKSSFEGKVDVGWNYSRISFIRGMWTNHTNTLASRLGKPLPQPTVQITRERDEGGEGGKDTGQGKITAVVNVPQSRYVYTALEPPVIETPQLRDMGEATPPLEWIGLHRDKLPHITHQIIIVTLMEIAKDVEDAYTKILGSS
ncbi:fermentation associated protein [Blastomyces gilchristii SLH14081]|uniref:Fermentation associated protein n=1 Tax=Blastomyces gilchristii (strain SLH14081) TaxID=559298 RepID=A0A179UH19_BLAGS|nr:fermentation associated protein [Blastomyces gilchristii SLH14081]OAT07150.1 fermentation associated protein [Blastomyces gilchristii SLH14081]